MEKIQRSTDPRPLEDYLRRYPSGEFTELAELQLDWSLAIRGEKKIKIASPKGDPGWRDDLGGRTEVWVFLGWTRRDVTFAYVSQPGKNVFNHSGRKVYGGPEIVWNARPESLLYPVTAEVYVRRLLDRGEFRRHCDTYRTRAAILVNLG